MLKYVLVCDESDLMVKNTDFSSSIEKSFFTTPLVMSITDARGGEGTSKKITYKSLYHSASVVIDVTATPAAFPLVNRPESGRLPVTVEGEPSKNNWQYAKYRHWDCKIITRTTSTSEMEMINHMVQDISDRYALVVSSDTFKKVTQLESAKALISKELSKDVNGTVNSGVVAFTWEGGLCHIVTKCPYFLALLRDRKLVQGYIKEKYQHVKKYKHVMGASLSYPFTEAEGPHGMFVFTGKGTAGVGRMSTYREVVSMINEISTRKINRTFVLYARKVTERAVPVKGVDHKCPLTDMYVDMGELHDESLIQILGRLCGLDKDATCKRLWASQALHKIHTRALERIPFFSMLIDNGVDIVTSLNDLKEKICSAGESGQVEDVHGLRSNVEGGKIKMLEEGMTRPNVGKKCKRAFDEVDSAVVARDTDVKSRKFNSGLKHKVSKESQNLDRAKAEIRAKIPVGNTMTEFAIVYKNDDPEYVKKALAGMSERGGELVKSGDGDGAKYKRVR